MEYIVQRPHRGPEEALKPIKFSIMKHMKIHTKWDNPY